MVILKFLFDCSLLNFNCLLCISILDISVDNKWIVINHFALFYRRLCPDISFFQQATDFPCLEIVGVPNSDSVRLHNRVQYTALSSGTVERRGIGMNKVTNFALSLLIRP